MKVFSITALSIVILAAILAAPARSRPLPQTSNIKVLTDMSETEIQQEMTNWAEALGTNCGFCHVSGDFASDMNPKKETARKMARMVKVINKDFLGGKAQCALCHRGATVPTL